ncbi:efflux RND transporter periplasmic adaptor subunit [Alteromonas sp. BMJM2]|uniref:efflux RND transporter periplasmic adaptor subunit n=1 Tax=Alteromonas sp. BMJM2 TaxID=2954241 RepID=UPI0022B2BD64|nr:efflux RND transporter periplasmic adaptor subunit [Alteromonas sp. BMJM2]
MANKSQNTKASVLIAKPLLIGFALGALALFIAQVAFETVFLAHSSSHHELSAEKGSESVSEKKPLYWVAPMDADYRRDQPGKSPMGMDLVPVFEEGTLSTTAEKGTVVIAPHVINNLGVRTALAERKAINSDIVSVGYVKYDEDEIVHIHPRVEGWIEKLYIKAEGNAVDRGEALYTLYSPQLVNAQEELVIALRRKNSALVNAAKNRLKALQLSPDLIEKLETTQQVQQNITFYAPQSGVVDGLNIREGFFVKPEDTLFSIAKLNKIWVEAEVYERDVVQISKGLPVSMTLDYLPGREWMGKVDYVYPALDEKTRTLRIRLAFDNSDNLLRPNMFANVTIHTRKAKPILVVPEEAVIRTGKQNRVVLALGDGKFKSVSVNIGRVSQDSIEILNGLNEGDRVVTSAQFLLDSESSKTSDFTRMESREKPHSASSHSGGSHLSASHSSSSHLAGSHSPGSHSNMPKPEVSSATVTGVINAVNTSTRIINTSREAIKKWNRPPATMDFTVAQNIDLTRFNVSDTVNFTFEIREDFIVVAMTRKSANPSSKKPMHKEMIHEEMSHENMSHEDMSHEDMSHEDMNHEDMNHKNMNNKDMNHKDMNHD